MEEETKEVNPYINEEIDTLFFNEKGLKTPYRETYEEVFGKPMTTNKSNINLGSYINGISKEEAKSLKPDVYKNGKIISGPSLQQEEVKNEESFENTDNNEINDEVIENNNIEPSNTGITMEDLFNKVNEGIINDKVYKRLNVDVTGTGALVEPEEKVEIDIPVEADEKIAPIVLEEKEEDHNVESVPEPTLEPKQEPVKETPTNVNPEPVKETTTVVQNTNSVNNANNTATDNNSNYEVVRTAYDNAERKDDKLYDEEGAPFAIIGISYLLPFIGIILYLTKHNDKERYARNCLLAGLFGVLTYAILGVIYSLYLIKTL